MQLVGFRAQAVVAAVCQGFVKTAFGREAGTVLGLCMGRVVVAYVDWSRGQCLVPRHGSAVGGSASDLPKVIGLGGADVHGIPRSGMTLGDPARMGMFCQRRGRE